MQKECDNTPVYFVLPSQSKYIFMETNTQSEYFAEITDQRYVPEFGQDYITIKVTGPNGKEKMTLPTKYLIGLLSGDKQSEAIKPEGEGYEFK